MQRRLPRFSGTPSWLPSNGSTIGVYGVSFISRRNEPAASAVLAVAVVSEQSGILRQENFAGEIAPRRVAWTTSRFRFWLRPLCIILRVIACLHTVVPSCKIDFARSESRCEYSARPYFITITSLYVLQCVSNERTSNGPAAGKAAIFVNLFGIGFYLSFARGNIIARANDPLSFYIHALFSRIDA